MASSLNHVWRALGLVLVLTAVVAHAGLDTAWGSTSIDGYKLLNNTRCNGHYRLFSDSASLEQCAQRCSEDSKCARYSTNTEAFCFLFDAKASCASQAQWISGVKDTRCGTVSEGEVLAVSCPFGTVISGVTFANFGKASGTCGAYRPSTCNVAGTKGVVEDLCVGQSECTIAASTSLFGKSRCVERAELTVQVECAAGPSFNEDVFFNAWSSRFWVEAERDVDVRRSEWKQYLASIPEYPTGKFSDSGILIVAGGKYLLPALTNIKLLRDMGCKLRIQIWHLGPEEMTAEHRQLLAPFGVETRDFKDYVSEEHLKPIAANVGLRLFQLKPLAMLYSDLENILMLDSDNSPIRDPSYLFDTREFLQYGTVFWADYWKTSIDNPIWDIVGVEPESTWEQESGQILINKRKAWNGLNLCMFFNNEFYMKLLNGDKDTFRFAWMAAGVQFYMMDQLPVAVGTLREVFNAQEEGFCSHTMLQHDPSGEPLFVHHNQLKRTKLPLGENFKYQKLPPSSGSFRTVPVQGLEVGGRVIPCNDVQGAGFLPIDEDETQVTLTKLGDFEVRFFQAQTAIPNELFEQFDVHDSLETLPLAPQGSIRMRRNTGENVTANCDLGMFEFDTSACELITACTGTQIEVTGPTASTDRVCESTTDTFTQTLEVEVNGGTFGVRVGSAGSFVSSATVSLSRGGSYEFQMVNVPATSPFTIETTAGTIFLNGVTNNMATGNDVVSLLTSATTPDDLLYADSNDAVAGGALVIGDTSTFSKTYVGHRRSFGGPFLRFNTAFSVQAQVFLLTDPSTTNAAFQNLRTTCMAQCMPEPDCLGIHVYQTDVMTACVGLNDLGESTETNLDSQSWTKVTEVTVV
eukprot:m.85347 g.85347  ORF g.85347 m.85347 type:complete len:861 (+) comp12777_c1_seq1:143-2725(+)